MLKIISVCCGAEVGKGHQMEFPLGGSKYGISYEINVCTDCGKEADDLQDVYCCDYCGEVSQDKMMVNPEGDDLCDSCVMEALRNVIKAADRLIEKLEGETA